MTTCNERKMRELSGEVERLRREESDRQWEATQREEEAYNRQQREREERNREHKEALRYPEDWLEAFTNALYLLREEERQFPEPGGFFEREIEATEKAQMIYREEMAAIEFDLAILREQIEAVEQQARNKAAGRIDALFPNSVCAEGLRENDPTHLTNW